MKIFRLLFHKFTNLITRISFIFDLFKFELYRHKKNDIYYYATKPRYGQFLSGTYLFYINSIPNATVIFVSNKNYYRTLKYLFRNKSIFFTKNILLYNYVRSKFKNDFSENYIVNFHYNEVIPLQYNLEKLEIYNLSTTFFDNLKLKINQKKVILIALKEKTYYENNNMFNNYLQPDFEFDDFGRLLDLAKYYCDHGYYVIRVGCNYNVTNFKHVNFYDYASSKFQNFENDVLISNISHLVISNQTGFDILPNLWFKKPLIHFTIRSYRFILDWPGIYVCPMQIFFEHKLLDIKQQMEIESKLWSKDSNQNDLYKEYSNNNYILKKRDSNEIILIVNHFINNHLSFDNLFWYNWHLYNDQFYTFLKREIPTHHFSKMIQLDG
jgi:putative glycosyltransferase (TIGR04372 family)